MKVTFYILPQSFISEDVSFTEIINNIDAFLSEYWIFDKFKEENEIIVDESIYDAQLPNGKSLGEYIYDISNAKGEERDLKSALQRILERHHSNEKLTKEKITDQINNNSIKNCTGIISMVTLKEYAKESQIVYAKDSWFKFRRHHLGLFHGDGAYFIDECKKFYPNLFFHENNKDSVNPIINNFAQTIIFHLNGMNDFFPSIIKENPNFNQTELLRKLSDKAEFPEIATPEGGKNKKNMKFSFKLDNEEKEIPVLCELHVKLCYDDSKDGKYHKDKRIYFHKGRKDIAKGKILIGHIGKHL